MILHHTFPPLLCQPLPFQEGSLLYPTLLHVNKEQQKQEASQTQRKQEVERRAIVVRRRSINNGARYQRANETRCLANDAEEAEEEELFAAWCDFGDHLFCC